MTSTLIALSALVLVLNLFGSVAILRSPMFSGAQCFLQLLVVWLVPIIGAIVCLVFVASQSRDQGPGLDKTAFADGPCSVDGKPDGNGVCGSAGDAGGD